jgi:hypothetical protein
MNRFFHLIVAQRLELEKKLNEADKAEIMKTKIGVGNPSHGTL